MNSLFRAAFAVVALTLFIPTVSAAAPDPADLFPPGTLVYAELNDPATVAPQFAAVVKGSVLEDGLAFIHKRRDTTKDIRDINGKDELALAALFTSPEMIAELKKIRGIAFGITGFNGQGQPEYALVVVTGDSNAVGIAVRGFLTLDNKVRSVGTVGNAKVPVYQFRQTSMSYDERGLPKLSDEKPTEGAYETTLAYTPGLFVVGSSKTAVGDVVTRFTGETKGSLSALPVFQSAAETYRKPGLFFYADVPSFCAKYDAALKTIGGGDPDFYAWFKLVAGAKSMKTLAGTIHFRDGGLAATVGATLDPAAKSPLVELLAGSGVKVELLQAAQRPAGLAIAVTLPEKNRSAAAIGFLDALAKADGELGRMPSEAVKELEAKYKLSIRDGLLGKTQAITVIMPAKQELPKGAKPLPLIVLHADGGEVAEAWEAFLPKLIADLSKADTVPQPSSETVNGVRVLSVGGPGLPWGGPLHYARNGTRFVIGSDRKLVASAAGGQMATSVIGGEKPAVFPPASNDIVLLGTLSPGVLLRQLLISTPENGANAPMTVPDSGPRPVSEPPSRRIPGPGDPASPANPDTADEAKALEAFLTSFESLAPTTIVLRRTGEELRLELFQPGVQSGGMAPILNAGMGWFDKGLNRYYDPNGNRTGQPQFGGGPYRRFK